MSGAFVGRCRVVVAGSQSEEGAKFRLGPGANPLTVGYLEFYGNDGNQGRDADSMVIPQGNGSEFNLSRELSLVAWVMMPGAESAPEALVVGRQGR